MSVIECSLEAADEDGNTALHLSLAKQLSPTFSTTAAAVSEVAVVRFAADWQSY